MSDTTKMLLDPNEAAELLGVKRQHLTRLARRGEIPRVKLGRLTRYPLNLLKQKVEELAREETR